MSDPEEDTLSPEESLLLYARNGDISGVEGLLEKRNGKQISLDLNCKGNQKSNRGWSPLHLAVYFGHTAVAKLLLEHDADVNIVNSVGDTPLHRAAYTGRHEAVTLLVQHKADIHVINAEGFSPKDVARNKDINQLLEAAENHENLETHNEFLSSVRDGNLEYIQGMLKSKKPPDVNKTDEFGNTALHIAAQSNQKEVAVLLLQSGVNVTAKNAKDQTAIDFAYNTPMKQLLSVTPVKDIPKLPHHWEGILLKKSRFLGFQALWVVLERGVLSYFKTRGDASSGVKRKGMKYLDNATVLGRESEPSEFVIHYSDGTRHTFSFPPKELDLVVKQKLFNILKEHITFSTHYTSQGKQLDGNNEEIISIRSIEDSFKTAEAHHNLLEKKINKMFEEAAHVQSNSASSAGLVGMMEQIEDVMNLSKEMTVSLKQCLTQFKQQEELRQKQLEEEMEKSRVLQEALHALATEHHELERTIGGKKSPPRCYDTDDDEFYDCDGEESGEFDMDMKSVTNFDAMSYQSADSGNFTCNKSPNCDIPKNGRTKLPVPMFDRNDFSIWSILKQCIGKELSKITMPVVFNEPLSFLQRISEYLEYAKLLEQANLSDDPVERLSYVSAFAVSSISSNWERIGKPFNPLLGETYEFSRPDLGFKIVSEQVSHHPPVSAFHAESPHFKIHGSIYPKLKFWGKSVEVNPKGLITLELLRHGETYTWSNINCCVHNVIVGTIWIEHYGPMEVINHKTKHKALLNFKQGGWFGRDLHKVEGFIYDSNKKKVKALYGSWVLDMYSVPADIYEQHMSESVNHQPCQHKDKMNGSNNEKDDVTTKHAVLHTYDLHIRDQQSVWKCRQRPSHSDEYFNFTYFAMSLNELTEDVAGKLAPTDSRYRPDIRLLEEGKIDAASEEKNRLEEKQRTSRKERKKKKDEWTPTWFKSGKDQHTGKETWLFTGEYWDRNWQKSPDIF
ncbi:oxysterol-binding protein-related protein 1-like isoform X2 [Mytilus edulis]